MLQARVAIRATAHATVRIRGNVIACVAISGSGTVTCNTATCNGAAMYVVICGYKSL